MRRQGTVHAGSRGVRVGWRRPWRERVPQLRHDLATQSVKEVTQPGESPAAVRLAAAAGPDSDTGGARSIDRLLPDRCLADTRKAIQHKGGRPITNAIQEPPNRRQLGFAPNDRPLQTRHLVRLRSNSKRIASAAVPRRYPTHAHQAAADQRDWGPTVNPRRLAELIWNKHIANGAAEARYPAASTDTRNRSTVGGGKPGPDRCLDPSPAPARVEPQASSKGATEWIGGALRCCILMRCGHRAGRLQR